MPSFEQYLLKEKESMKTHFVCLNSSSVVDTKDPLKNEFILGWEKEKGKTTFILLNVKNRNVCLAGSGTDYGVEPGDTVGLYDDGNGTTQLPKYNLFTKRKSDPVIAKVVAVAESSQEIKTKFPAGKYKLWVMK